MSLRALPIFAILHVYRKLPGYRDLAESGWVEHGSGFVGDQGLSLLVRVRGGFGVGILRIGVNASFI